MPSYTFINKETNESMDRIMSIAERDAYLAENPHIKQALSAPPTGDSARMGVTKVSDGFNDILKHVKKSHLHSTIQTRN